MSNPVSSVFIIGGPTLQSGPIGKDTPKVVQTVPTTIPHAATESTVDEAAVVRVEEVDILKSTEPIMTLSDYNIVPTKPLDDGDGLGIGGYAQYPQCPDPSKDVRGRAGLVDDCVSEKSSALMPRQQSRGSGSDLIHTTTLTMYRAEVEQGAKSNNDIGIDMDQIGQDEITQLLQEKRRLVENLGGDGEDVPREGTSIRPSPEPPPRGSRIRLQPITSSAGSKYYITDGDEYSIQECDDDLEVMSRRSKPDKIVLAQGADDLQEVPTRVELLPNTTTTRRRRRRRWSDRNALKKSRVRTRERKNRSETFRKKDKDGTVWLQGTPGEPRLSLQYRVKPSGSRRYVTTGVILAFVNVRTLRQKRKPGYSGSFNTKSTKNNWKIPALIHLMTKKGIYMMALSETRRTSGVKDVGNGFTLVTSQNEKYSWLGGTGFLLSPSAAEAFRAAGSRTWTPPTGSVVSGRYLEIGLAAATKKEGILTFGSVYAPTMQSSLEVRRAFWSMIEDRIMNGGLSDDNSDSSRHQGRRRPVRRIYMAMGDWNARVGRRTDGDPYNGVLGPHNFSNRNANGSMMLETMVRCNMRIANTFYSHDKSHTATWTHSATGVQRVIDHLVVRAWQLRHVTDVQSRPGWNVDSDHEVCTVTLKGNPRGKCAHDSRWKISGLTQRKGKLPVEILVDENFELGQPMACETVTSKIATAMEEKLDSIHDMSDFDEALRLVAKANLPAKPMRETWAEGEHRHQIETALERRRRAMSRAVSNPGEATTTELKDARRSLRRITRRALYTHLTKMCNEMQSIADAGKGLSRDFFRELSNVKRFLGSYERPKKELMANVKKRIEEMDNFFKTTRFCQQRPLIDEEEILSVPPIQDIDVDAIFSEPDRAEVLRAVSKLKNGKTTDIKGVQAEVLKAAVKSPRVGRWFADVVINIWRGSPLPAHWLDALGFLIWKGKHPKSNLKNWRVVNLIAISSKVVSKLMHWRLQRLASRVWSQTQYGFRPGSWTMDAIFVVTRIMEDFRQTRHVDGVDEEDVYRNTLYWMFEDYSTAFDGVPRDLLWKILRHIFRVPEHFVDLLRRFHDGFRMRSVVNNLFGKGFITLSGVRQGCLKAPDLWNFHMQAVLWVLAARMIRKGIMHGVKLRYDTDGKIRARWEARSNTSTTALTSRVRDSTYADDSAVPAPGLRQVVVFQQFWEASRAGGSEMSLDDPVAGTKGKTKVMKITQEPGDWRPTERETREVHAGGVPLPFVKEFLYLGSIRSTDRDLGVSADINRRLAKGTGVMATLEGLWKGKYLTRKVKGRLMTTFAIPTALYGCANWALTSANVRRLRHWWFKMLKWTFGIHHVNFRDTGQTKRSMMKALGVQPIMVYVRRAVVQQIGHIARKSIENPAKQLLFGWVADRVPWRRGATGRRKAPPRTLREYYKATLKEIPHPMFDMRIWSLQAQDRNLWRKFAHSVHGNTNFGGGHLGSTSMATRTQALRDQRLAARGDVVTEDDPTQLQPNRKRHWTKCPLRCGWEGEAIGQHIANEHALHPVQYQCVECEYTTNSKAQVSRHVKRHGGADVRVALCDHPDTYRWDYRSKFLRAIPHGEEKPRPVGWLKAKPKRYKDESSVIRGLFKYKGENNEEQQLRAARRKEILRSENVSGWRELSRRMQRRYLKTLAATEGWGPKDVLRTRRPELHTKRKRSGCGRRCGWGDHTKSTPHSCPLHPDYVGHLKPGGKPAGIRGDSDEAKIWKAKVQREAQRREEANNRRGAYECRNLCGASFDTKAQRSAHERSVCTRTPDGAAREQHQCSVPGCTATYVNQADKRKHEERCWRKFNYESPTCPSCGFQVNNTEEVNGRTVVTRRSTLAPSQWESHVLRYKRTRMVTCSWCGEYHLIPGCMSTPRELGRAWRCSDNFLIGVYGSEECRRLRPRMGGDPVWLEQYRNEMQQRSGDDDAAAAADLQPGWESNEEGDMNDVSTNERNGAQQQRQRHIHVPQRMDEDSDIDQPTGYDEVVDLPPTGGAPERRREGRRRARRRGRRRRRMGMVGEAVD